MPGIASSHSRQTLDLKMRNLVQSGKPVIDIALNAPQGQHGAYVTSYSTLDRIEGVVAITPRADTKFDDLEITFEGIEKTYVDKLATTSTMTGRTTATHKFLRLAQPVPAAALPTQPRILRADRTYTVPFTFVVPAQLLPRACTHKAVNSTVRQAHLQLPPSLGDPELSGYGGQLLDDMAPEMARISYMVKARLTKLRHLPNDFEEVVTVNEKMRKVRVKPAFEESAPLSVDDVNSAAAEAMPRAGRLPRIDEESEYRLRAEKNVRKGLFKGKLGRLVMEASQPPSLHLPSSASPGDDHAPVTTMTRVKLRFDPADTHALPPRLGSLTSKFKVTTFFATHARTAFPTRRGAIPDMSQGVISESLPLASRCVASAGWERHEAGTACDILARRDSGASTSDGCARTASTASSTTTTTVSVDKPFYTASLLVPITLPHSKHFVPTFHTCLLSRVYALSLTLSAHSPGHGAAPTLSLRVPVQVSADGGEAWKRSLLRRDSALSAVAEDDLDLYDVEQRVSDEVDEVLRPRSMMVPSYASGGAVAPPPGYEALMGMERGRVVPVAG